MLIKWLHAFVILAEQKNFTKAADLLYITQSALSKQILSLENHLGTCLFIRGHHSVVLTDAGNALLPEAKNLLSRSEKIAQIAKSYQDMESPDAGSLTIVIDEKLMYIDFFDTWLLDAIELHKKDNPNTFIDVMIAGNTEELMSGAEHNVDICIAPVSPDSLDSPKFAEKNVMALRKDRLVLAVPSGLAKLGIESEETLRALNSLKFFTHDEGASTPERYRFLAEHNIHPKPAFVSWEEAKLRIALGEGYIILPEYTAGRIALNGIGILRFRDDTEPSRVNVVAYWDKKPINRHINAFMQLVSDVISASKGKMD
jgi:DNA-binding transcriptional LysR family regulator